MNEYHFHFLISENLKTELNNIKKLSKYSFSGKINFILMNTIKSLIHFDKLKINEESIVETLEEKIQVHLYTKSTVYKVLKIYHGKFNSYSLAFLVRLLIKLFLDMENKYGFEQAIKKLKKEFKNLEKINKKSNKKLTMIQLLNYLGLKQNKDLKLIIILTILLL